MANSGSRVTDGWEGTLPGLTQLSLPSVQHHLSWGFAGSGQTGSITVLRRGRSEVGCLLVLSQRRREHAVQGKERHLGLALDPDVLDRGCQALFHEVVERLL